MYKLIIGYLIIIPINGIFYLQWANSMKDYKWLLTSIIIPLLNIIIFLPSLINTSILPEVPQKSIFIVALLEYISNFLFIISITNISYLISLIVNKSNILIIMCCSYIFLNKKYLYNHYIGIFIILIGISLSLVNKVNNDNTSLLYILINLFSVIIHCFSFIYQEKYIKKYKNINTFLINLWINIWQLVIGIFSFPLIFIPFKDIYISPNNISRYLIDGFTCQFVTNCNQSILWGVLNEIFYILSVYLMYNIFLYGSSLVYQILLTLKIPITICLTYILINYNIIILTTSQQFIFTIYDYCSIILITIGSFIYLIYPEINTENTTNVLEYKLLENNI